MTNFSHSFEMIDKASKLQKDLTAESIVAFIANHVQKNELWRGENCLNLLAAESPSSLLVKEVLGSDLATRAAAGGIGKKFRYVKGTKYIDEIEAQTYALFKQLYGCEFIDLRPLSGCIANHIVYQALAKPGDRLMSLSENAGGDPVHRRDGAPGLLGLNILDIPFNPHDFTIDLVKFEQLACRYKPQLIGIGASNTLFPVPMKEIKKIVEPWGAKVIADIAHEAGLIAGRAFPNPLEHGADVIVGTTGKTFSGPHGGFIAWNDSSLSERLSHMISPVFIGTHQVNRIAATGIAAAELLKFGHDYMSQIVANAKSLASTLDSHGLSVCGAEKGFSHTHQIIVNLESSELAEKACDSLERCNVITQTTTLPENRNFDKTGLRLGLTEATRLGMKEDSMREIAAIILSAIRKQVDERCIKTRVKNLRQRFQDIHFCFNLSTDQGE